eukprot:TRINITY_DN32556_c0_g1_i1.p1 TRINITY_DN32556_c0_g1~~TRINITY_DN32556_c0_g1_i1.p1  ORF type:complete len:488 (-),score=63.92 TRINITY_DN32556_c0_g1_i1:729-2192(-)
MSLISVVPQGVCVQSGGLTSRLAHSVTSRKVHCGAYLSQSNKQCTIRSREFSRFGSKRDMKVCPSVTATSAFQTACSHGATNNFTVSSITSYNRQHSRGRRIALSVCRNLRPQCRKRNCRSLRAANDDDSVQLPTSSSDASSSSPPSPSSSDSPSAKPDSEELNRESHRSSSTLTSVEDPFPSELPIPSSQSSSLLPPEQKSRQVEDGEESSVAEVVDAFGVAGERAWLAPWPVPWGVKSTALGMVAWLASFLGSGLVIQILALKAGWTPWRAGDPEQQALFLLLTQGIRTGLGVAIVWAIAVRPNRPLDPDFFSFDLRRPFNLRRGWLLWTLPGFLGAALMVELVALGQVAIAGAEPPRESADALLQVLPIIAISPLGTFSLVMVAGVFAPVLEETIFRGFLMTSLTKWMPVPLAVILSASAFALAHLTPSEFPKLATLGCVLGFTYARTRNLLTPMIIHAVWNSGIIVILTLLRLEGYDLKELIG